MDRLRSGCPWDAEQTHASLAPYVLEEAFELAEVAEAGDRDGMLEELGDVLLQVVFHARIAAERAGDPFDIDDVARTLVAKLVRRHPHVFADDAHALTPGDVEAAWDRIKDAEKARRDPLEGVPRALPALARAQKTARRLRRAGVPDAALLAGPDEGARPADVVPATTDATDATDATVPDDATDAVGRELMALVLRADAAGVDAEAALRAHVRGLEALVHRDGGPARA
ncbi:MazG family protein [Georgenia faecalis]|uniref:MazG nucleotide pyrophosphohydrolase domain-containing protein n=1 Tax=Georgenia faecalis TaxID=2483799 RepID=A0ABV9D7N8_9MICO|nr:MazG family protein [Georgenia faecalis]